MKLKDRGLMKSIKATGEIMLQKFLGGVRWPEWELSRGRIDKNTYYDRLTELVMKRVLKPTSVCIDVGCHEGSILRLMMKYAPNGTFFAFEPIPHLYEKLKERFKQQNVKIYDLALSDSKGTSSFNYVITNPGYSGLKKRRYDRPHEEDTQIEVKTELLDTVLSHDEVGKISFMKIDVEGGELQVMRGAQTMISRDKPIIVFEHGLGASEYYGTKPEDVFDLLCNTCGLGISLLSNWLRGKPSLDLEALCDQYYHGKNYYYIAHE